MNTKLNSERLTASAQMHGLRFLSALITAIGLALAVPAQATIVVNGGFETGDFTGWTLSGNTGSTGVECPGPAFVAEGNCDAFLGPVGSDGTLSQLLSLVVGQHYLLSFAFASDEGTPSHFSVSLGGVTLLDLVNPGASPYHFLSFDVVATAASEMLAFNFRDDPGFLHLDAVSLVPEPASVGLLGVALIAMVIALRRKA